jgi:tol-pal system protein YbgF
MSARWTKCGGLVGLLALVLALGACRSLGGGQYVGRNEFEALTQRVSDLEVAVKTISPGGSSLPHAASRPTVNWEGEERGAGGGAGGGSVFVDSGLGASSPAKGQGSKAKQAAAAPAPAARGTEKSVYQEGQRLLKQKKYDQAGAVFTQMLTRDPGGSLAPNARYCLGECHYASGRYAEAAAEFQRCADDYPESAKAPDALLKLSYSYDRLGDGPRAMGVMDRLLTRYPGSQAADMVKSGQGRFSG